MLANRRAFATIPATDMERAKRWYEDKLGLKPASENMVGAIYELGGGSGFLLYPTEHAGKAPNTLMGFESTDMEGDVAALKAKGVVFEEIDEGDLKTVNSIATIGSLKGAWFRDSENNILSLGTDPRLA
jgi:catechol 2,3-dioxygenase-like lactoylglutathione lyase family enzyme